MNSSNATGNVSLKPTVCSEGETTVKQSLIVLAFILSAFAFAGNSFVIILAAKYTVRKNLHHLIINMAVMDLGALLFYQLYWTPVLLNLSWNIESAIMSNNLCFLLMFLIAFFQGSSLVTLLIISIQRFKATQQTLQRTPPHTLKRRLLEVAITYVASAVISVIIASAPKSLSNIKRCTFASGKTLVVHSLTYATALSVAIFSILSLNVIVMRKISNKHPIEEQISEPQRHARAKRTGKVVKMVLCSLVIYFFCYIPLVILSVLYAILRALDRISGDIELASLCNGFVLATTILALFLPIINALLSPIIYIAFLKDFNEAAKKVLCRRVNRLSHKTDSFELKQVQETRAAKSFP